MTALNARRALPAYGRTHKALLRNPAIGVGAKALWAAIDECAQYEHISQEKLAAWFGVDERTIRRWVKELEQAEWLQVEPQYDRGRRVENIYVLLIPADTDVLSPGADVQTPGADVQEDITGGHPSPSGPDTDVRAIRDVHETNYPSGHLSSEQSPSVTRANGSGEPLAVGQGRGSPLRPSDPSVTAAPSPPTEELSVAEKLMARAAPSYVVPRQVRAGLCRVIDELLSDGMAQAHVVEGLEEFWTRDRPHPRLLANLAMDAARDAATRESYYQTPEYQICKPDPVMLARMAQPYDPNEDD